MTSWGSGESDLPAWSLVSPRDPPGPHRVRQPWSGHSGVRVGGAGLALTEKRVEVRGWRSCPGVSAPSPDVSPEPSAWGARPTDHTPAKRSELVSVGARRLGSWAQALGFTVKRPPNPGPAQALGAPCPPWSELSPLQGPRKQENGVRGGQKGISDSFLPELRWLLSNRPFGRRRGRAGGTGGCWRSDQEAEARDAGARPAPLGLAPLGLAVAAAEQVRGGETGGQRGARVRGAVSSAAGENAGAASRRSRKGLIRSLLTGKEASVRLQMLQEMSLFLF